MSTVSTFKEIVHTKMEILSSFTHTLVVTNLYAFLSCVFLVIKQLMDHIDLVLRIVFFFMP